MRRKPGNIRSLGIPNKTKIKKKKNYKPLAIKALVYFGSKG
jgi:hypothetical protein